MVAFAFATPENAVDTEATQIRNINFLHIPHLTANGHLVKGDQTKSSPIRPNNSTRNRHGLSSIFFSKSEQQKWLE
jgi:hypothetical protein